MENDNFKRSMLRIRSKKKRYLRRKEVMKNTRWRDKHSINILL